MVKKTKTQSTKPLDTKLLLGIGLVILVGMFLVFSSGNSSITQPIKKASELSDNTQTNAEDTTNYDSRKDAKLSNNEDVDSYLDSNNGTLTTANVTTDSEGNLVLKGNNDTTLHIINKTDINDLFGNLKDNIVIKQIWVNKNYDVNGFDKYFQAVLFYDNDYNMYKLRYSIDNQNFSIDDLHLVDNNVINSINNNIYIKDTSENVKFYVSSNNINDLTQLKEINSLIKIKDNNLFIGKTSYFLNDNTCYRAYSTYITNFNIDFIYIFPNCYQGSYSNHKEVLFSINDLTTYSQPTISSNDGFNTRTTGFNTLTIVKQEANTNNNGYAKRYIKLASNDEMAKIYDTNKDSMTSLLQQVVKDNIDLANTDNFIEIGNNNTYELGVDTTGIIINGGYFNEQDVRNGTIIETSQIKFSPDNSKGLEMNNLGLSSLKAEQQQIIGYGNMKDLFSIQTHGQAYIVESSLWDRALGIIYNTFAFDFSSVSQYWNDEIDNPVISDDKNKGNIGGDSFVYNYALENSNSVANTFTTQKPLSNLLKYNGNDYWLFYDLETSSNTKGCIIINTHNTELDVDMPMSLCGSNIGGINSVSQFKIAVNQ